MTKLRITLDIPEHLIEAYEIYRGKQPLEEFLVKHLESCVDYHGKRPLFFTDKHVKELETLTGGRILDSPEKTINRIRNCQAIRVSNPNESITEILLTPTLLTRMKSRCFGRTLGKAITEQTILGLERYCGMR